MGKKGKRKSSEARQKLRGKATEARKNNISLITDSALIFLVGFIMSIIVYDLFSSGNPFIKLIYSMIVLLLLMVMYFLGIIPALSLNMVVVMATIIWSIHSYMTTGEMLDGMLFWLLIPTLIVIDCYILTQNITKLQEENRLIKAQAQELSTVDEETHLRTSSIYKDHFDVFSTLSRDYDLPLYLYVTQIRYWNAVSGMLSKQDREVLIRIISDTITQYESGHEFVYYIDSTPPTWAILSTVSNEQASELEWLDKDVFEQNQRDFKKYFKDEMYKNIQEDPVLKNVSIQIAMASMKYDPKEHSDATTFLADAIHELQYDV